MDNDLIVVQWMDLPRQPITSIIRERKFSMSKVFPILLSSGSGTRLWPLSSKSYPKQFSTQTVEKQKIFQLASNGLYRRSCEKISIHEVKNEYIDKKYIAQLNNEMITNGVMVKMNEINGDIALCGVPIKYVACKNKIFRIVNSHHA